MGGPAKDFFFRGMLFLLFLISAYAVEYFVTWEYETHEKCENGDMSNFVGFTFMPSYDGEFCDDYGAGIMYKYTDSLNFKSGLCEYGGCTDCLRIENHKFNTCGGGGPSVVKNRKTTYLGVGNGINFGGHIYAQGEYLDGNCTDIIKTYVLMDETCMMNSTLVNRCIDFGSRKYKYKCLTFWPEDWDGREDTSGSGGLSLCIELIFIVVIFFAM